MSDQDFFFDEEETASAEDKATKPARAAKAEPKTPAKSPAKAAPVARKSAPSAESKASSAASLFEQSVSMALAALMTVIGLLIGVIIGFVVAPDAATVSTDTPAASNGSGSAAPQLSDEQLQSGTLPEGHPDISSMGATGTAETPSE